jgi:DNA-binding MarR family transcriptional regulator
VSLTNRKSEILKITNDLMAISEKIGSIIQLDEGNIEHNPPTKLLEIAEAQYRLRRSREKFFDPTLLGEPVWDLLLDLFINGERCTPVSISSACLGAAVPTSTALRCIKSLLERGLLLRVDDWQDKRRSFLLLSQDAREMMIRFLEQSR